MPAPKPSVVLAHDWLNGFRGGERVLEAFCALYPEAPIYTLMHTLGSTSPIIESKTIHTSFLNSWPGIEKKYRLFLPLFPTAAESLKITESPDVLLSSCHCVVKGIAKPKDSVHVSYVYSPMRYLYDQFDNYFGPQAPMHVRLGGRAFRRYLTNWDIRSNENVDFMVGISNFVRDRIRTFYKRDADVIYPFVELADFAHVQANPPAKDDFYIIVSAFAPNKRVDLAVDAFTELGKPLVIIGSGQLEGELKRRAGPNIRFLGNATRAQVIDHLARARALIFPGVEDFGITPLEALAARTPVIAHKIGGVLETLTDEDTVFFAEPTVRDLVQAVQRFEKEGRTPNPDRLKVFSRERFLNEIEKYVEYAREQGKKRT